MFYQCEQLTSINLSSFNTDKVKNMRFIFGSCHKIDSLDLSNINISSVRIMDGMFYNFSSLKQINISHFDTSSATSMNSFFNGFKNPILETYFFNTSSLTNIEYFFANLNKTDFQNYTFFDTSHITSMAYMFANCKNLVSLDLSQLNTSSVTSMEGMFSNCNKLTTLNFCNFITSKVTDMSYMFSNCISLPMLDLSNFDTSQTTSMEGMFYVCQNLTTLELSSFKTSIVRNMKYMFYKCSLLQSLNLSSFKTEKVYSFTSMFENCNSLISLNLENFNNSNAVFINNMFRNCINLEYINIRNIKGYNNYDYSEICRKYNSECSTTSGMFSGCIKLNFINIFSLLELVQYSNMFKDIISGFTYCINNQTEIPNIISQLSNGQRDCSQKCYKQPHRLIINTNECVIQCDKSNGNKKIYGYKDECYEKCPNRTKISKEYNFVCEDLYCQKYYNYNESDCLNELPEGFYLKNEALKTIDKRHKDRKFCFGKENINNTNCKSCPTNKYLYLRNCLTTCTKGYFKYNQNGTLIDVCNCENISCQYCTIESLKYNLCETCNMNNGYYPKINDTLNKFPYLNCYKEIEGFYIDYKEKIFKPCHPKCKTCSEYGDDNNNNCLICKNNFTHRQDFENDKNCYDNCPFYYYYDSKNNYQCTLNDSCPTKEYKFIKNKNKCIFECSNDNIYKYEFENLCYEKCPINTKGSKENDFICILDCPENLPFENKLFNRCVNNCTTNDLIKKFCIIKCRKK